MAWCFGVLMVDVLVCRGFDAEGAANGALEARLRRWCDVVVTYPAVLHEISRAWRGESEYQDDS